MEVVIIGSFTEERREAARLAAQRADAAPVFHETTEHARQALRFGEAPRAILVDGTVSDLEGFVAWVRGEARLFTVPVILIAPVASDAAYNEAQALGADDVVVEGDVGGVTRRLANLVDFDPRARPITRIGTAVIAHAAPRRRRLLGRILRMSGFNLAFAQDADELVRVASTPLAATGTHAEQSDPPPDHPVLLVASAELPPAGPIEAVRGASLHTPLVVLGPTHALGSLQETAAALPECSVGSDQAPPDHLLFLANELLRGPGANNRASSRVLHGSICGFRPAGALQNEYGLTYNISREGMYVRTLDPPSRGATLWLELRPPGERLAVHLRGECVWVKKMDRPGGAAPPGFGIRLHLDECPPKDLDAYHRAYDALQATVPLH
ncbi:MAG: PilZ domain-containing protein [Myxococcota bacterium]